MTVEIVEVELSNRVVTIRAVDCSEERLQHIKRMRDDGFETIAVFVYDTTQFDAFRDLRYWLMRQKATRGSKTYGEALRSILGTVTTISSKYRVYD